jgi:hypothetical protein
MVTVAYAPTTMAIVTISRGLDRGWCNGYRDHFERDRIVVGVMAIVTISRRSDHGRCNDYRNHF